MSGRGAMNKFVVCRVLNPSSSEAGYEVRTLFALESCEEAVDELDGSRTTVFRRDGEVVDSAGELCGAFEDFGEAKVHARRLGQLLEVMES